MSVQLWMQQLTLTIMTSQCPWMHHQGKLSTGLTCNRENLIKNITRTQHWPRWITYIHGSKWTVRQASPSRTRLSVCRAILSTALRAKDIGKAWLSKAFSQLTLRSANKGASVTWIWARSLQYLWEQMVSEWRSSCLDRGLEWGSGQ